MIKIIKKINLISSEYLNSGNNNWSYISKELRIFSNKKGINCYEWLDKSFKEKEIHGDWIGFLHNTITYPAEEYPQKYNNKILCIKDLIENDYFLNKIKYCKGIFVFTDQLKNYIIENLNFTNVEKLVHPCIKFNSNWIGFDFVLHVGQQLRKYHSFLEIKSPKKKFMIVPQHCENDLNEMKQYSNRKVDYLSQMSLSDYVNKLCRSVVFLDLYDVSACNTILECINLNVPLIVKRLPGSVEYLGDKYPLYFDEILEAEQKLNNNDLIFEAHCYLKNMNKKIFEINYFLNSFCKSRIFINL